MTSPEAPDLTIGKAQKLARKYKNTPKLRAVGEGLGSLVPFFGQAAHTYLIERLSQLERERVESLYSYFQESGAVLTPELIESDDFVHCFTITVRAARRTRRKEKIRLFAGILSSVSMGEDITDVDEYEELVSILDELSWHEILCLSLIDECQRASGLSWPDLSDDEHREAARQFWDEIFGTVESRTSIRAEEVEAVFTRLGRTGLYALQAVYGGAVGIGYLTPRWYRLSALIADADGNVISD